MFQFIGFACKVIFLVNLHFMWHVGIIVRKFLKRKRMLMLRLINDPYRMNVLHTSNEILIAMSNYDKMPYRVIDIHYGNE